MTVSDMPGYIPTGVFPDSNAPDGACYRYASINLQKIGRNS